MREALISAATGVRVCSPRTAPASFFYSLVWISRASPLFPKSYWVWKPARRQPNRWRGPGKIDFGQHLLNELVLLHEGKWHAHILFSATWWTWDVYSGRRVFFHPLFEGGEWRLCRQGEGVFTLLSILTSSIKRACRATCLRPSKGA